MLFANKVPDCYSALLHLQWGNEGRKNSTHMCLSLDILLNFSSTSFCSTIHSNCRDSHVGLYGNQVPLTVQNFLALVKQGVYNSTVFNKVPLSFSDLHYMAMMYTGLGSLQASDTFCRTWMTFRTSKVWRRWKRSWKSLHIDGMFTTAKLMKSCRHIPRPHKIWFSCKNATRLFLI